MNNIKQFSYLLEKYFSEYLKNQKNVSVNTISSYRDTFRLLCIYASEVLKKKPAELQTDDIDDVFINEFLDYLEKERNCHISTRNQRLAAIHSFYNYISYIAFEYLERIQKILSIPIKKCEKKLMDYLEDKEIDAVLDAPKKNTWIGFRDYTILSIFIQTGFRVSELLSLRINDIILGESTYIHCIGKGRKERNVPINKTLKKLLEQYLKLRNGNPDDILFISRLGKKMSRDIIEYMVKKYTAIAQRKCSSLKHKKISPHSLRHTNAMLLLSAGVDCTVIALWLGHVSIETTKIYLNLDVKYKEKIINQYGPFKEQKVPRFKADDKLLLYLSCI